jgi:hypothetical protein
MNWFWLNVPAMVVFFVAITGIPLWLSVRHSDTGPAALAAASDPAGGMASASYLLPEVELVGAL